jgi:hypothetical protein
MSIEQIMRWTIFALVITFAAWVVSLLVNGLPWTVFPEVPPGDPPPPDRIVYRPYQPAIFALLALLPAAVGMLREAWTSWAWASVVLLLLVGALLIFSMGYVFIIAAGVLAVLLAILQWQYTGRPNRLLAGWAGVGLLLVLGILFAEAPVGIYVGASAVLLALVLAILHGRSLDLP